MNCAYIVIRYLLRLGGHLGRDKTVEKTCSRFYWGHCMHAEIQTFIRTCEQCQRVNDKFQKPTALLHPIPVEPQVWYQVQLFIAESIYV